MPSRQPNISKSQSSKTPRKLPCTVSQKVHKKSLYQRYQQPIILFVAIIAAVVIFYLLQLVEFYNPRYTDAYNQYQQQQQQAQYNSAELNATLLSIRNALTADNPVLLYYATRELVYQEGNTSRSLYYQFRSFFDTNDVRRGIGYLTAV